MRELLILLTFVGLSGLPVCLAFGKPEKAKTCNVTRLAKPPEIDARWDKMPWKDIQPLQIANYMGEKPTHRPKAEVKIAYDEDALYLIFRVEDRYVRAVTAAHQGQVWEDSCVEFFFTPGTDPSAGYFNLEMNCGGTFLLHFQRAPRKAIVKLPIEDCRRITVAHSLPKIVDPEIETPVVWTVEYRIPIDILRRCSPVASPASGVTWRANFYKCADESSHPHWLTWSPVDHPKPDFHRPEFFGALKFD